MCRRHFGPWNSNSTQAQTEPPATHHFENNKNVFLRKNDNLLLKKHATAKFR